MNKSTIHIILFLTLMVIPQIKGLAQKTDTIVHTNGNILKGDFKKMEYGIVTWKMDGMGTISVEIPFVSTIVSQKQFEIVMKNGTIYYSSFEASDSTGAVVIDLLRFFRISIHDFPSITNDKTFFNILKRKKIKEIFTSKKELNIL